MSSCWLAEPFKVSVRYHISRKFQRGWGFWKQKAESSDRWRKASVSAATSSSVHAMEPYSRASVHGNGRDSKFPIGCPFVFKERVAHSKKQMDSIMQLRLVRSLQLACLRISYNNNSFLFLTQLNFVCHSGTVFFAVLSVVYETNFTFYSTFDGESNNATSCTKTKWFWCIIVKGLEVWRYI